MNTVVSSYRDLPKNTHAPLTVPMSYRSSVPTLLAFLAMAVWMFALGYYASHSVILGF